jgi:predicted DNA-binding transcriptional regulator YafY
MSTKSKNARTLNLYARFCEGKTINKREEALRFGVDERSIQRDIDDIRAFLSEHSITNAFDTRAIIYDRAKEGYVMVGREGALMTNDEVLAVSKILLESRAFTKKEMGSILDKLIAGCVPQKNMKLVSDLIANEKYHYVELKHRSVVKDKLWQLGEEITECNLIEITYQKQVSTKEKVKRVIQPVAIIFSEYYFYLIAFIVEKNERGRYEQKYDYPAVFRVDRILKYRELGEKFKIAYKNRFEEGAFRKRVQFMFPGELTRLQFRYTGRNVEAILDRLPTADVRSQDAEGVVIEAEVYGNGILMWLLSQGTAVEVLRPQSMRAETKKILLEMLEKYKEG